MWVCFSLRLSFKCRQMYHAPTDCATIRKWLTKCADDSETANYISAHTKDVRRMEIIPNLMSDAEVIISELWERLKVCVVAGDHSCVCFSCSVLSAISALRRTEGAITWWVRAEHHTLPEHRKCWRILSAEGFNLSTFFFMCSVFYLRCAFALPPHTAFRVCFFLCQLLVSSDSFARVKVWIKWLSAFWLTNWISSFHVFLCFSNAPSANMVSWAQSAAPPLWCYKTQSSANGTNTVIYLFWRSVDSPFSKALCIPPRGRLCYTKSRKPSALIANLHHAWLKRNSTTTLERNPLFSVSFMRLC